MKQIELENKYGKIVIRKILREGYLDGCTMAIDKDGSEDIYECDIINAIKEIKGKTFDWD